MIDLLFKIDNGSVVTSLTHSPDGWNGQLITFERSMNYYGVFYSFSIPLKFVKEGATLLRTEYYTKGISANCKLQIWKRSQNTNEFELKYTGRFNFSNVTDDQQTNTFKITLISGDLATDVKNKEGIKYDITLQDSKMLRFNGIPAYFETARQTTSSYNNFKAVTMSNVAPIDALRIEMDEYRFLDVQGGYLSIINRDVDGYNIYCNKACHIKLNTIGVTRRFELKNISMPTGTGPVNVIIKEKIIRLRNGVTTVLSTLSSTAETLYYNTADISVTLPYINNEIEIDLLPNDEVGVFLYTEWVIGLPINYDMYYITDIGGITQEIGIYAPLPQATFKVISILELGTQLAQRIGNYDFKSDYLTGLNLFAFTPRTTFSYYVDGTQITTNVFQTSLTDYFKAINSLSPVGMGFETIAGTETIVIEPIQYFLDKNEAYMTFNDIANFTISTASEWIPNEIMVGYNEYSYADGFGLQEFMGKHSLKAPQELLSNQKDLICPYRMDNNGFDYCRKLNIDMWFNGAIGGLSVMNKVGDVAGQDDIYLMDCEFVETLSSVDYYILRRGDITITDVNFKDPLFAFNLAYTPMRNLLRHGAWLRSALKFFETSQIVHTYLPKYPYLETQEGVLPAIAEGLNPLISDLDTPFFMPFVVTFTAPFTDYNENLYLNNGNLLVKVLYENKYYYGFVISQSKKLAGLKETEFKILLTSLSDLTDLY